MIMGLEAIPALTSPVAFIASLGCLGNEAGPGISAKRDRPGFVTNGLVLSHRAA